MSIKEARQRLFSMWLYWERMCQRFSCGNCPLEEIIEGKPCSFWAKRKPEDIIKAIQKWSDSNEEIDADWQWYDKRNLLY